MSSELIVDYIVLRGEWGWIWILERFLFVAVYSGQTAIRACFLQRQVTYSSGKGTDAPNLFCGRALGRPSEERARDVPKSFHGLFCVFPSSCCLFVFVVFLFGFFCFSGRVEDEA
jgi:hypothetical protein